MTGRSTPVGPPWIFTKSGYLRVESKFAGLVSTPSISAPSVLFQVITSRTPATSESVCDVILVSTRGVQRAVAVIATSGSDAGDPIRTAAWLPSRVSDVPITIAEPRGDTRVTAPLAGSMRYS